MTVTALLVSHDGARWLPAVLTGLSGQTLPVDRVVAVDTTSRDDSVTLVRDALGEHGRARRRARLDELSRRGAPRPRAGPGGRRRRVDLAAARRQQPRPDGPRRAARRRSGAPLGRDPRPQAARVALAAPPPRGRPDHHRHRAPRDRSGAGRVRPGPARRRARGARGQHRRDARAPLRAGVARRARRGPADLRQRHRLRLARRAGRAPDARRPAGRGLPRRGRAPRHPAHAAHRAAHALPGAARRPPHLAGQRLLARVRLAVRPALPRLAAARRRLPRRAVGGRGARRARRCSVGARATTPAPGRAPRAGRPAAGRPRRRTPPAGPGVVALPPRTRLRHRPRLGRHQPGRRRRRAAPPRQGRGRARHRAGRARGATRVRDVGGRRRGRLPHRLRHRGPLLHQPGRRGAGALRRPVAGRRPRGLRLDHRRRAVPGAGRRGRLVAPARLELAPARHRHRRAGPCLRAAVRVRRDPPARPHRSRRVRPHAARRPGGGVGRVAAAQGRRTAGRPAGAAALAAWCGVP